MQLVLATALTIVSMHQVYSSTPTMNGGICTQDDMMAFSEVFVAPVWANCTSVTGATLKESNLESDESIKRLCASTTCTAFLSSLEKQVPNCIEGGMNLKTAFQMSYGCTPAAAGAPCSRIDTTAYKTAAMTPVWANCSTFLKLPQDASIKDVMPVKDANVTSLPTGYCTSTCPQYVLSVVKSLPSCTIDGKNVSDISGTTLLYTLCPNVKPENKPVASPAAGPPVWANCSTFLDLPGGATIDKVLPKNATATSLPAGFCTSTCPQYLLSVVKSQPSSTMDGNNLSDPTFIYTLCPNVKPENKSGASTHHVYLWSYVVVLVTAVATLF